MVQAEGIFKRYRKQAVLNGVSFTAEPGDCFGIIGMNGCGKTTLLSILAGVLRPDAGSIRCGGREAVGHPKVFSEETAYVPQENPLMEELSVKDNLRLWYRGDCRALEADLKSGFFETLGIAEMYKKQVCRLSGGMKKRLSIACALANHARVLILDEPGAALDLECREAIHDWLSSYMEGGGTVILTSHEPDEISLCTKLSVLKGGRLTRIPTGLSVKELTGLLR